MSLKLAGLRLWDAGGPWTDAASLISSLSQHWPDRQCPRSALMLPKPGNTGLDVQGPPTNSRREREHSRIPASC